MPFKIVGADENSDFPPRVETKLASKFANKTYVDDKAAAAQTAATQSAKTYTDTAISEIDVSGLTEDPNDPGFFI